MQKIKATSAARTHKFYFKVNVRHDVGRGRPHPAQRYCLDSVWPEDVIAAVLRDLRSCEFGGIEIFKFPADPGTSSPEV